MINYEALRREVEPLIEKRDDGHWMWIGVRRENKRYGVFKLPVGTMNASRAVYMALYPEVSLEGKKVQRMCDVHYCVNPAHHDVLPLAGKKAVVNELMDAILDTGKDHTLYKDANNNCLVFAEKDGKLDKLYQHDGMLKIVGVYGTTSQVQRVMEDLGAM